MNALSLNLGKLHIKKMTGSAWEENPWVLWFEFVDHTYMLAQGASKDAVLPAFNKCCEWLKTRKVNPLLVAALRGGPFPPEGTLLTSPNSEVQRLAQALLGLVKQLNGQYVLGSEGSFLPPEEQGLILEAVERCSA